MSWLLENSLVLATLIWFIVASEALYYAVSEFRDVWRGWAINREYGNGRRAISRRRVKMAVAFAVGFFIAWAAGVLSGGLLIAGRFGLIELPAPDYSVSTAIVRLFLVGMIFSFRSAMKSQRAVRKELEVIDAAHDTHLEKIVEDTHDRVVELHKEYGPDKGTE